MKVSGLGFRSIRVTVEGRRGRDPMRSRLDCREGPCRSRARGGPVIHNYDAPVDPRKPRRWSPLTLLRVTFSTSLLIALVAAPEHSYQFWGRIVVSHTGRRVAVFMERTGLNWGTDFEFGDNCGVYTLVAGRDRSALVVLGSIGTIGVGSAAGVGVLVVGR